MPTRGLVVHACLATLAQAAKELLLQRANEMQQRALEALQLAGQPDDTAPLVEGESAAGVAGDAQAQQETSVTIQHHESAGPSLTTPAMQVPGSLSFLNT